jgi:hypothetical protein
MEMEIKPNKLGKLNRLNKPLRFGVSFLALLIIEIPSIVHADFEGFLSKFQPSIAVQEEYNSNIDLTPRNGREDYITTVYPGLRFSTSPRSITTGQKAPTTAEENYGIDLDYRPGFVFYAKEHDNNYISHAGTLNTWYTFDRRLTFRVRDYLIRSDELRETDYSATATQGQYLLSTQNKRVVYIRNVAEPSVEYQFGREDRISINYRNNIYKVQSDQFEDSREDYIDPKLTYWFNIRNGISLEYALDLGNFQRSPDMVGHMGVGRYTYRFNPRTSIFGEYTFLRRDFDPPGVDYDVHRPSLGIEHAFSPTLSARIQAGYFWQIPVTGSTKGGLYLDMNLTQRAEKTTYTLSLQGGYTEDYFTAQNLGFTKYYRGIGTITHRLLERMTVGLSGSLERAAFSSDRKDWTWGINGNASYTVLKWLTLSLEASHRENNSNIDNLDYSEYRGIFRVTASF